MSACISREGEYSEHQIPATDHPYLEERYWPWVCGRCGVLNDEALLSELERLREGVKALAEEWAAEDSSEWHYAHQPDVGRAIEAVKGALVPELRGLLDEDGGANP